MLIFSVLQFSMRLFSLHPTQTRWPECTQVGKFMFENIFRNWLLSVCRQNHFNIFEMCKPRTSPLPHYLPTEFSLRIDKRKSDGRGKPRLCSRCGIKRRTFDCRQLPHTFSRTPPATTSFSPFARDERILEDKRQRRRCLSETFFVLVGWRFFASMSRQTKSDRVRVRNNNNPTTSRVIANTAYSRTDGCDIADVHQVWTSDQN